MSAKQLRALLSSDVTFELTVEQDDIPVKGNALASGDDLADRECENEILHRLDQGDVWAWAHVTVTARWKGWSASDSLGACSYASEQDFRGDAYFADLKSEALASLNETLQANASDLIDLCE